MDLSIVFTGVCAFSVDKQKIRINSIIKNKRKLTQRLEKTYSRRFATRSFQTLALLIPLQYHLPSQEVNLESTSIK